MGAAARMFWIDAFTDAPFGGNPAAVCLTDADLPDPLKQGIARELNLSETVFIWPHKNGYAIRWFTPTKEVPLVGHATLAAAYVVLTYLETSSNTVVFFSPASGELAAYREGAALAIELPADRTIDCPPPADLIVGLGAPPDSVRIGRHYMALFADEDTVAGLQPNFAALARLDRPTIIATAPGTRCDYVLRFFAPANGVPEDPVSGVAQCSLAPYWSSRLVRDRLVSDQLSTRSGRMCCWMRDDRVVISGACCPIAQGEFDPAVVGKTAAIR
jgi:predicted PhzF superfamily epimerase YddE/YHI9